MWAVTGIAIVIYSIVPALNIQTRDGRNVDRNSFVALNISTCFNLSAILRQSPLSRRIGQRATRSE